MKSRKFEEKKQKGCFKFDFEIMVKDRTTTKSFKNNFFNKGNEKKRKRMLKGRDYKYIYYNRRKFVNKFYFLSKMKMV